MKICDEFCGQQQGYSISKTLRFELKPQGKTLENIKKEMIIERDFKRSQDYKAVKIILDNYHKFFIDDVLKSVNLDWSNLSDAIAEFNKNKDDGLKVASFQETIRKEIVKYFKSDSRFNALTASTPKDFFNKYLTEFLSVNISSETNMKVVETFKKFSTYFTGYQENRKNIYTEEAIPTAVPYRIVNDNFPRFLKNIEVFNEIKAKYPEIIEQAEQELQEYLGTEKISDIFNINNYNNYLTQSGAEHQRGIDYYNQVIGGVVQKENSIKKRGLNEFLNLYYQGHSDVKKIKFIPLYKQILSDRTSLSFKIQSITNDEELKESIKSFEKIINKKDDNDKTVLDKVSELTDNIDNYDLSEIYINQKDVNNISRILTGDWAFLQKRMNIYAQETFNKKEQKRWIRDLENDNSKSKGIFSLKELNDVLEYSSVNCPHIPVHIQDYFNETKRWYIDSTTGEFANDTQVELSISEMCKQIIDNQTKMDKVLNLVPCEKTLREKPEDVQLIKDYLDSVQNLLHRIKPFKVNSIGDISFYAIYDSVYSSLNEIVSLYNKTRNFITKKNNDLEKFKLNFENPTLADGWDQNKENDNTAIILIQNEKYYLGVMNAKNKPIFSEHYEIQNNNCYKKMIYKLLPGPNKMLPKVFLSNKGKKEFNPPEQLLKDYEAGKHKKGATFDISFCYYLIDWFKDAINRHKDWRNFNFIFSDTSSYNDISDFYREVSDQAYKVTFTDIPQSVIDKMVDDGQLFLFQIYNKDFAEHSKGTPNLHTIYWQELFSEENLKEKVLKLNGQAELFYRNLSIEDPVIHKAGSKLVNKFTERGHSIPENIYTDIYKLQNGMTDGFSCDTQKYLLEKNIVIKDRGDEDSEYEDYDNRDILYMHTAQHDIVKDKHFTEPKFLFHVPITINYKAHRSTSLNEKVRLFLRNNKDVNIIGLDRGERHLVYLSLINQKGEILEQCSLNTIALNNNGRKIDYHEKLEITEKERDDARKNWKTIGKIAELKEGYLSAVIYKIAQMMINNNAIVVMEDLNYGFKRGRFHVEKQVYQKFEHMLIDKLNYLVFKNRTANEPGGALNGYQLTDEFVSFKKIGKQSGFLFYVPAEYTSKIDPKTGFVNIFDFGGITNIQKKREFFKKFESIKYDSEKESFAFTFDYKKFGGKCKEMFQTRWTVYSKGERIVYSSKSKRSEYVDPTRELKEKCFKEANIKWDNGADLLPSILKIGEELKIGEKPSQFVASFYDTLFRNFKLVLQMRNSDSNAKTDYILSPVKGDDGTFFDSNSKDPKYPIDADANGAYHIALKGLTLIKRIHETDEEMLKKMDLKISNEDWFKFVQNKEYLK